MTRYPCPMVLLSAVAGLAALPAAALEKTRPGAPPPKDLSQTRRADRVVKITWDNEVLWLEEGPIHQLLFSSGVAGVAGREVFGRPGLVGSEAEDVPAVLSFRPEGLFPGDGKLVALLSVEIHEAASPAAEELLEAVCARLRATLAKAFEQELDSIQHEVGYTREEVRRAEEELVRLQELRAQLCQAAGRASLSREEITGEIRELRHRTRELEMELVGQRALQGALEQQIANTRERLEARRGEDPIAAELEQVVQLRERQTDRARQLVEGGAAPGLELAEAEGQLAMARLELQRHRMAVAEHAGAGRLSELNDELASLSVRAVEIEARLRFVSEKLAEIGKRDLLGLADRYEREIEARMPLAAERLEVAMEKSAELEDRLRGARPPAVTVLGGALPPKDRP